MRIEVLVPQIGEDLFEVKVVRVLVEEGDRLAYDQVYMSLATDKVDIELPSNHTGTVIEVKAKVGEILRIGEPLLVLETDEAVEVAERNEESANVRTALRYLARQDAENLCSRQELGAFSFDEFKGFVEETITLARENQTLPLGLLDEQLVDRLQKTLYWLTSFVAEIQRFDPNAMTAFVNHAKIARTIREDHKKALARFIETLESARQAAKVGFWRSAAELRAATHGRAASDSAHVIARLRA